MWGHGEEPTLGSDRDPTEQDDTHALLPASYALQLPRVLKAGLQNQIIFGPIKRRNANRLRWGRSRRHPSLRMGDLLLVSSRDRLPPASLRGRASGHTGAQAGLWGPWWLLPSHAQPSQALFGWKLGLFLHKGLVRLATCGPSLGDSTPRKHNAQTNIPVV